MGYFFSKQKEVNVRKFIALLCILTFVFSLNTFAKDAFSFEPYEYPDSFIPLTYEGMEPFFTGYRNSLPADFSICEGEKWWHGTHAIRLTMTHAGASWILLSKNAALGGPPEYLDSTFLTGLDHRDTIFYYVYIPWTCPIDSIFIFVRNANWAHDDHKVYHPEDLSFGRWNELKDGISDDLELSEDVLLVQSDFQIDLIAGEVPACTLYIDAISSKGRVPGKYTDTTGQAGIEIAKEGILNVAKASINCVEYNINVTTLVMVQVYDLTGRKQKEMPIGMQSAGAYNIPLTDLPAGVYLTSVTAGEEIKTVKTICVK